MTEELLLTVTIGSIIVGFSVQTAWICSKALCNDSTNPLYQFPLGLLAVFSLILAITQIRTNIVTPLYWDYWNEQFAALQQTPIPSDDTASSNLISQTTSNFFNQMMDTATNTMWIDENYLHQKYAETYRK